MSRWHKLSCHTPKVSVEDGQPRCQSCGTSPDVQKLISEQPGLRPPWAVPPDERFGEMNLSWPESVLYSPKTGDAARTDAREAKEADALDASSPIYKKKLGVNGFRLLYLPAADYENHPIHANLEAYHTDDCPEYETVSYCWGGENGDASLYKPVFLGNYWDILLQTNNCWSMLRYLRPRVGVRIVWVDAICINQKDHRERESQVAIMGSIYERCQRAVVYLGQDMVRSGSTNNRTYPARRDLTSVSASAVDLHQLLKMRYFQRVWVIQELIRAPMVVIPVHGMELTARRHTASSAGVAWQDSDAPWMRHICAAQPGTALQRMLEQTRNSQSTDPRDKVFGLLGFLGAQGLRPNYLLSSLHIYIGTVAYMLLNEGHSHLLTEAAGHQAPSSIPSWLPDGDLSNIGSLLRKLSTSSSSSTSWGGSPRSTFREKVLALNSDWETLFLSEADNNKYYSLPNIHFQVHEAPEPAPVYEALESSLPTAEKPSIHPSTSALSLPLIYLWESSSRPVEVHWDKKSRRVFQMTAADCTLYICTSDSSLDSAIEPGLTRVLLLRDKRNPPLLFFMRRLHPDAHYRLLKCFPCADIFLSRQPSSKPSFPPSDPTRGPRSSVYRPPSPPVSFSQGLKSILDRTVYDVISQAEELRNKSWAIFRRMRPEIDPSDRDRIDFHIFDFFHKLFVDPTFYFVDLYLKLLRQCSPDCFAKQWEHHGEAWVHVTMNPNDWLTIHESLNPDWYARVFPRFLARSIAEDVGPWYWTRAPGSSDSFHQEELDSWDLPDGFVAQLSSWTSTDARGCKRPASSWFYSSHVTMVAKVEGLRGWLTRNPYFSLFSDLWVCSQLTNENELTLATTAPKPEYRSICFYHWPRSFFNGEDIPGKQQNVIIF